VVNDGQVGKLDIPRLFDYDTLRSLGYWVEGLSAVDQLQIVRLVVLGVEHALSTTISLVQFFPYRSESRGVGISIIGGGGRYSYILVLRY
jgi:hypothetical protein